MHCKALYYCHYYYYGTCVQTVNVLQAVFTTASLYRRKFSGLPKSCPTALFFCYFVYYVHIYCFVCEFLRVIYSLIGGPKFIQTVFFFSIVIEK